MEVMVKEKGKNTISFEIKGADHTLCNILKTELHADSAVTVATYRMGHPLIAIPTFFVHTDGTKEPLKAVQEAIARLKRQNTQLAKDVSALK
ncbi:MAG: DNA-directed RNA polymerase subunit L [Candidatus Woesearchaeota archaeon]